jgi:hypothetical protein
MIMIVFIVRNEISKFYASSTEEFCLLIEQFAANLCISSKNILIGASVTQAAYL